MGVLQHMEAFEPDFLRLFEIDEGVESFSGKGGLELLLWDQSNFKLLKRVIIGSG